MNNFDFSLYDNEDDTPSPVKKKTQQVISKPSRSFDFSAYEEESQPQPQPQPQQQQQSAEEEGLLKSTARYAAQIPLGIANATPYGIATGLSNLLATGDVYDPEEIDRIRAISEREGIPFDEEKYLQAAQNALGSFPTVSNLARMTEEATGLPLEPKTRGQKALNFASTAGKLAPQNATFRGSNTALPRPILGAGVSAAKEGLTELNVPEPISDIASFAVLKNLPPGSPKLGLAQKTKPSGLLERRFEKLEKPTQVSEKKIGQINEKLENDFKRIADDIIAKTPIEETRANLKNNPKFKTEVQERFKEIETLAESIPEKVNSKQVTTSLDGILKKKEGIGFLPSEYDRDYRSFVKQFIKQTPKKDLAAVNLVEQFRKNNRALVEYYDPQRTKAYNRAKKDALLDYNRAIADVIEKKYPDTEFSKLFPEQNKQWSKILDSEAITDFVDGLFDGKVNFKEAKKFFENENLARPFKRSLGEEGFKQFETLVEDLLSSETPYKMLKAAKSKGWNELAETAGAFILHPELAKAKFLYSTGKNIYKGFFDSLLDKPQYVFEWKKAVDSLKKGDFRTADKEFKTLNKQLQTPVKTESPKKAVEVPKKAENINDAFSQMGAGITEGFYRDAFKALKEGKSSIGSVKDPFIEAAKINYEKGLIKSEADLKKFSDIYFQKKSTNSAPHKQSQNPKKAETNSSLTKDAIEQAKGNDISKKGLRNQKEYLSEYGYQKRIEANKAGNFKEKVSELKKERTQMRDELKISREKDIKELELKMIQKHLKEADLIELKAKEVEKHGNIKLAKKLRKTVKDIRDFQNEMLKHI